MLNYSIPSEDKKLVLPIHRRFQAGISALANQKLNALNPRIDGIYKYEGGVVVAGKEIAIKRGWVVDDFGPRGASPATPEETATVEAMGELIDRVKNGDDLSEYDQYAITTDTLRSFFEDVVGVKAAHELK